MGESTAPEVARGAFSFGRKQGIGKKNKGSAIATKRLSQLQNKKYSSLTRTEEGASDQDINKDL